VHWPLACFVPLQDVFSFGILCSSINYLSLIPFSQGLRRFMEFIGPYSCQLFKICIAHDDCGLLFLIHICSSQQALKTSTCVICLYDRWIDVLRACWQIHPDFRCLKLQVQYNYMDAIVPTTARTSTSYISMVFNNFIILWICANHVLYWYMMWSESNKLVHNKTDRQFTIVVF